MNDNIDVCSLTLLDMCSRLRFDMDNRVLEAERLSTHLIDLEAQVSKLTEVQD